MKTKIVLGILICVILAYPLRAEQPEYKSQEAVFSSGLVLGYNDGFKFQGYAMVSNFASGFPMNARFSLGYTFIQPGNAADARRIFINNATNGIPEDHGRILDFRMDLMFPVKLLSMERAFLIAGPRHSRFKGNFKYIGGNEDFDVTCNQWGLGSGLETYFRMSEEIDLVLSGGLDYFFQSTLKGHDTAYNPDDENINPREDYTYDDADKAINQPKFELSLMFGFSYNF